MTGSNELGAAIIGAIDDDALEALAMRLAPKLELRLASRAPRADGWLDAKGAAEYLGMSKNALHKLTAARTIPFEQDGPGCKLYFKCSDLDDWRRAGSGGSRR